jgi:tetratricopeptide (TPR) repeat protein
MANKKCWMQISIIILFILCYVPLVQAYDKNAAIWYNQGLTLVKENKNQEALEAFDQTLSIEPNDENAWYWKGKILYKLQKWEESVEAYNNAITIDPNFVLAWDGMGESLTFLHKRSEAIVAYNRALAIDPEYGSYRSSQSYEQTRIIYPKSVSPIDTVVAASTTISSKPITDVTETPQEPDSNAFLQAYNWIVNAIGTPRVAPVKMETLPTSTQKPVSTTVPSLTIDTPTIPKTTIKPIQYTTNIQSSIIGLWRHYHSYAGTERDERYQFNADGTFAETSISSGSISSDNCVFVTRGTWIATGSDSYKISSERFNDEIVQYGGYYIEIYGAGDIAYPYSGNLIGTNEKECSSISPSSQSYYRKPVSTITPIPTYYPWQTPVLTPVPAPYYPDPTQIPRPLPTQQIPIKPVYYPQTPVPTPVPTLMLPQPTPNPTRYPPPPTQMPYYPTPVWTPRPY